MNVIENIAAARQICFSVNVALRTVVDEIDGLVGGIAVGSCRRG